MLSAGNGHKHDDVVKTSIMKERKMQIISPIQIGTTHVTFLIT